MALTKVQSYNIKSARYLLLEFPLSVVQRTHLPCFEPARDAVEVKSMLEEKIHVIKNNCVGSAIYRQHVSNALDRLHKGGWRTMGDRKQEAKKPQPLHVG